MKYPISIMEFAERFATEQACWEYLVKARWPNGFVCPIDGTSEKTFIKTRKLWTCQQDHQISATALTVIHKSRTPLRAWFWTAYLMTTKTPGISALQLARQLNMRYETVYMMMQKLRAGMVSPFRTKLKGTIEVDETTVGGEGKGRRGRAYTPEKSIVLGAVEQRGKYLGRIRLRMVEDYRANTLIGFIHDHVTKQSTIVTDGFKAYAGLEKAGFRHRVITGATSRDVAKQLKHIHIIFSNLKAFINGTYHGVSGKHLQAYLNEFMFRFNRRKYPMQAFNAILGIGSHTEGPEYRELYHSEEAQPWQHVAGLQ